MINTQVLPMNAVKSVFSYELHHHLNINALDLYNSSPLVNKDFVKYLSGFETIKETRYTNSGYKPKEITADDDLRFHVIVCVHGLGGCSWDLMQLKNSILTLHPDAIVYSVTSIEDIATGIIRREYR